MGVILVQLNGMTHYTFSVVNNIKQYNQCVNDNPHLSHWDRPHVVNTPQNNISIAKHYNKFIETVILPSDEDGWVIFCHQDFEFLEDPLPILQSLPQQVVYGPIGMQRRFWLPGITRGTAYGQLRSGPYIIGKYTEQPQPVDTLDCCCLIVHTSLLKKQGLRFDEQFDFHLYAEDFCLQAHQKNLPVQAVQINSIHYSNGTLSKAFFDKYSALLKKFPQKPFVTTCVHIRVGKRGHFPSLRTVSIYRLLISVILPIETWMRRSSRYTSHE